MQKGRREFLANGFKVIAGAGIVAASAGYLGNLNAYAAKKAPKLPWPFEKFDIEKVGHDAYRGYFEGACCYGVFSALIDQMAEKVGYPYTMFPVEMMKYGEGGVVGWGTICGTLNGAAAAITLIVGEKGYKPLINEIMQWYTAEALPNYVPPGKKPIVKSIADLPLCHVSVMRWCDKAGVSPKSKPRKERCARLTADVAMKAAELINDYYSGKFRRHYVVPSDIKKRNAKSKMNCAKCHE